MLDLDFYKGKTVLVTGHTGFKGTWLCKILINAGAKVVGYSLEPPTMPNLFELSEMSNRMISIIGDVREYDKMKKVFEMYAPEIVFHLAAQPIVRESYINPRYTYETNVMGTVNVLECIRLTSTVKSFVNVTTDKVYKNNEWAWGYRESDVLDGFDPYSNSKSCSELVTHSFAQSFFENRDIAISTVRAGNVIGGGDFAKDRIIPDCIKAVSEGKQIEVRNPFSIRPYQHVLEPLYLYLLIAECQYKKRELQGCYNVGPDDCDCVTTGDLVDLFVKRWGENATWNKYQESNAPHEATFLKLDCSKAKSVFGWKPTWHIDKAIEMVCQFTKVYLSNGDIALEMDKEINEFLKVKENYV